MKQHLQRYASAMAIVLIAFSAYALLAVPRIEPSVKLRTQEDTFSPGEATSHVMDRHRKKVEHIFPAGSWQLQSPKVLETEHGTLVFKDYKPLADGRMELKPVTLIVYSGQKSPAGKASARPIIMDAPEGAVLQFDSATDPARADFGRLTGGLLTGPIRIHSPATSPTANDALQIVTRNVQLDERRIWTPHAVNFRYGPSYGSGRDLVITMLPPENQGKQKKGPAIEGMKTLELVHVDKFHFETAAANLMPGMPPPASGSASKGPPAPVEVTCQGPFMFDFEQSVASFEDAVDVIRLNPDGPSDQLNCQLLSIYLNKKEKTATPTKSPEDKAEAFDVERVVAVGHPVVLRAPSMAATARGQRLEYHFPTRRILLDDNDRVMLMDDRFDIEAKQLEYQLAESGGLGRLWAAGPGRLRVRKTEATKGRTSTVGLRIRPPIAPIASRTDNAAPLMFEAQWQKQLLLQPQNQQHVVSLIEGAGVRVGAMGGFTANEIHLWLNETLRATNAAPRAATNKPGFGSSKFDIDPDRMLALGNVRIAAEQLDGNTQRLEAWFRKAAPIVGAPPATTATPIATSNPTTNPLGSSKPGEPEATAPPKQKFHLDGDVVRIQLFRQGEVTTLDEVGVEGHVRLSEYPPAIPTPPPPLVITGSALRLQGGMNEHAVAHIFGEPAEVSARGTTMRGSNIHLHRGENRAWVEGPGEMLLPLAKDLSGAKIERPSQVAVSWQQSLEFDGQLAQFVGNVQAQTQTKQWARADTLDVTLTQAINFMQAKAATQPQVAVVEFDGHFALENPSYDKFGKLASIEKMEAQSMRIEQQSGDMKAAGPGWVSTVRLGGGDNPLAARTGAPPPPRNANSNEPPTFNYLFVEFQLQAVGNIYQRQVEFQRHVRSVYGPVDGWQGKLDVDRIETLGEQGVALSCQRLALREMPGSSANSTTIEMEATGDTLVEGRTFTARAARIGYVDEKQLLVLEGDGRRDAELTRQEKVGGPQSNLKAQKIMYWKFDNRVHFDGVSGLEFNPTAGEFKLPPR
ncbi:MAG TPA: hypothetical protein VL096_08685 [Pirellulaceae bacterium]|nr:hypothetical protein [Pirellulaceae bacterium]